MTKFLCPREWTLKQRIEYYSIPEPNSGCVLWLAALDGAGYPVLHWHGRMRLVSRLVLGLPDTLQARHKCDNPICVNEDHLLPGTPRDNINDALERGRYARRMAHYRVRLTEVQAEAIRNDPRSEKFIMAEYGIGSSSVSRIKRGKRWRPIIGGRDG